MSSSSTAAVKRERCCVAFGLRGHLYCTARTAAACRDSQPRNYSIASLRPQVFVPIERIVGLGTLDFESTRWLRRRHSLLHHKLMADSVQYRCPLSPKATPGTHRLSKRYTSPRMRMKVLYGEDAGPSDEELEARAMRRGAARRGRRSGSRFGLVGATEGTSERSGMRDRRACRR